MTTPRVITNTSRFGLTQWSADSDAPINRTQMNTDFGKLESLALRGSNGTLAARPPAGIRDRLYQVTSGTGLGQQYWDSGSAWILVDAPKTVRTERTFSIAGEIAVSGADFYVPGTFVPEPVGQTNKLAGAYAWVQSGTVTLTVRNNSSDVAGLTGIVINQSTYEYLLPTPIELLNRAYINLHVTAVSGTPKNMSVSILIDSTV